MVVSEILNSMKKHFPRWMDIRRKYNSSGSLLLESIAEETADISIAIEEYKKDFFIDKYLDNEDEILAFLYKATVGQVEIDNIILINPDIKITLEKDEFFEEGDSCLYSDGVLYFKKDYKEVQYAIDKYKSTTTLEKIHTWNIFDEFAVFVGIRRYQWETNKELVNRILAKSNKTINSTESGIKEALLANLVNIAPELTKEDITIERPTPENLIKYYDSFETILDHLNKVNRDVFKNKKWDVDTWNFAIKSVDYIPHVWDIALKAYVNGIGDNDDLKVDIIDDNAKTDIDIKFYKKSVSAINSYIKNHNIKENFELSLIKYDNDLSPEEIKYRISASETTEINPVETSLKFYEERTEKAKIRLQDITDSDDFLFGVNVEDKALLDSKYNYRLKFYPEDSISNFKINKLKQGNENSTIGDAPRNLIEEKSGFKFLDESKEGVICSKVLKHITSQYQYSDQTNVIKTINGFEIDDMSTEAKMTLNINGCANELLSFDYECKEIPILFNYINRTNCYIEQDSIVPDTVEGDKFIHINAEMNSISMTIEGPYSVEYSINKGGYISRSFHSNVKNEFKIDPYHTPQNMEIKIKFLEDKGKISNILYSKYDLVMTTERSDFAYNPSGSYLPSYDLNNLYITMRAYTGFSPVLKYVHVGSRLTDLDYYGDILFDPANGNKLLADFEGCRLQLEKLDKQTNKVIETIENYAPYKHYSAKNNNAQIELFLDQYHNIQEITADDCEIETMSYGDNYVQCLLKIPAGVKVSHINISGSSKRMIRQTSLDLILNTKGYSIKDNYFYAAKNCEQIIIKNKINNSLRYTSLQRRDLFGDLNISSIEITYGQENELIAKFIERSSAAVEDRAVTISNTFEGYFDFLTFVPTDGDIYKAINSYYVIFPETTDINIVNTFTAGYDKNKKMFYSLESFDENYDVKFSNDTMQQLDEDKIKIIRKNIDGIKYNYEEIIINQELPLNSMVELPSTFILPNKEQIELERYIISNFDNVVFKTKHDDPEAILDYLKHETLYVDGTGFNKLKYSNIHEIVSISISSQSLSETLEENVHYKILNKEGIVVWLDKKLILDEPIVSIKYYIKKARYLEFDIDDLYNKVKYNVNSLELINKITLERISAEDTIDLNLYTSYKESDLTSIYCYLPGFVASIKNDILTINKDVENNTVAVKTGFYYMDGNEYYMFADDNFDNVEKIDDIYLNNVIKENKKFILRQQTTNFIKNTSMILNTYGDIYNLNCNESEIEGTSKLNTITACESFNYWKTVASNLSIVPGYNGQGLSVTSISNINGYAYIPVNKFLTEKDKYVLSFYMSSAQGEAYLGKERIVHSTNSTFNKESVIDLVTQIKESEIEKDIYEVEFNYTDDEVFYLIIANNALVDDIIVTKKSKYEIGIHEKNISHLKLDIEENIYADYNTRLYLTEEDGATLDGTEIGDENNIVNTSYIHWGFTDIKKIESYGDFSKCILSDIQLTEYNNKCVAKTTSKDGYILTNPIYIGNTKVIKNLVFKINNVMFSNMKGFKVKVLTADSANESFKQVSQHLDNIGCVSGDNLLSYVKLMVEMPSNKVINNIELFIEYLSNEVNTPADMSVLSGTYVSKVLDAQYSERFSIKNINITDFNRDIGNYIFEVRASKNNNEQTVWTDWKKIILKNDFETSSQNILNNIVFEQYRFFQFRLILKGENASIKANYIDLEVI